MLSPHIFPAVLLKSGELSGRIWESSEGLEVCMPTSGEGSSCDLAGFACFNCVSENTGFRVYAPPCPLIDLIVNLTQPSVTWGRVSVKGCLHWASLRGMVY